jgi:hypothetical protein
MRCTTPSNLNKGTVLPTHNSRIHVDRPFLQRTGDGTSGSSEPPESSNANGEGISNLGGYVNDQCNLAL